MTTQIGELSFVKNKTLKRQFYFFSCFIITSGVDMKTLQVQNNNINFKSSHRLTKNGNIYYHTNSGLITGGIIGGGLTGGTLVSELVKKDKPKNIYGVMFVGLGSAVIASAICDL